jgi:hypothetical protein
MIFPKGQAVYENLNTSFTNFGELLLDLRANAFTGYVQASFWEYEGILFLDNGNIVNAVEETGGSRMTGQEAVNSITSKVQEKDGTVSVYALSGEMVTMLASVVRAEVVHKDLSTDFTSLEQLIAKLQSEGHTGYVEVAMKGDKGAGIIFLQGGDAIESILSTNGDAISGAQVLPRVIETASTLGAAFNVYRAAVEEAFDESAEVMAGFDLPQLLEVWQEIIATVETTADGLSSDGQFLNTFKDTLIEKADDYPFLDPFAAEFDYRDGQIAFQGQTVKNFSQGLGECLSATIGKLAAQTSGADLAATIAAELATVKERHAEAIDKFALGAAMPDLLT